MRIAELEIEQMERSGKTAALKQTLIYLDNRDLGEPVHPVNHLHDQPVDINITHTLSERMLKALEKADERTRNR